MNNGYHGDTIGAVSVGSVELFHQVYGPLMFDSFKAPIPNVYRSNSENPDQCRDECLNISEQLLLEMHQDLAGLTIEAWVKGPEGRLVRPVGFLSGGGGIV